MEYWAAGLPSPPVREMLWSHCAGLAEIDPACSSHDTTWLPTGDRFGMPVHLLDSNYARGWGGTLLMYGNSGWPKADAVTPRQNHPIRPFPFIRRRMSNT